MKSITINNKTSTKLSSLNADSVIITEIQSTSGDVHDIFSPIKILTVLPTGETFQSYFNPIQFYSNRTPAIGTDIKFELPIHYCRYTELLLENRKENEVSIKVIYKLNNIDLVIKVLKDLDGYNLSLPSQVVEKIISRYPKARPARNLFISYNTKDDFNMFIGKVEKHIIPALTDLTKDELETFGDVKLIDALTNKEIKTL